MVNFRFGLIVAMAMAAAPLQTQLPSPEASAAVDAAFNAFIAAARAGDRPALERLTDPGFVQHHGYGLTETRTVWLGSLGMAGPAARTNYLELAPSVRISGSTAMRTSFVRLRRPERGLDTWTRSNVVLVRDSDAWRVSDVATALLWEGPISDAVPDPRLVGEYRTERGETWRVADMGGMFALIPGEGRFVPMFPIGGDRLFAGYGSTLRPVIEGDAVVAIERYFGERLAFRATRVTASSTNPGN